MRPQAYTTPHFFTDDWLNDYYSAKAAQRVGGTNEQGLGAAAQPGKAAAQQAANLPRVAASPPQAPPQRVSGNSFGGGDGGGCSDGNEADAPEEWEAADNRQEPCIATSDYRFVYMGPKVSGTTAILGLPGAVCKLVAQTSAQMSYSRSLSRLE